MRINNFVLLDLASPTHILRILFSACIINIMSFKTKSVFDYLENKFHLTELDNY